MNPIQKALDTADVIIAANRDLERLSKDERPLRTSEAAVRAVLPAKVPGTGAEIVTFGRFVKGDSTAYAGIYALAKDAGSFSTHLLVLREDEPSGPRWFALSGNYDLSFDAASADLRNR